MEYTLRRFLNGLQRVFLKTRVELAVLFGIAWFLPRIAGGVDVSELNVTTVTELDNAIPEKWDTDLRADAERMTFWGPNFEGPEGSGKPIIRRDDFTKEPGDTIHVQTFTPLAQAGVAGATTLAGTEEQLTLGQFDLTADWVRHAVAFNRRATRRAVFNAAKVSQRALSKWMAKNIDDDMWQRLIVTESPTTLFAGNVASATSLGSGDVFTPDEIDRVKLQLQSLGSLPFGVIMDNGQERPMYGIVVSEVSEYQLKSNSTWTAAQRDGGIRGEKNKLFTGAMGIWNGTIIYTLTTVQVTHQKWGSFMRPEARVEGTHTAAVTTLNIGSTNTRVDYNEYFPSTGVLIVDRTGEIIEYTGKGSNGETFTGLTRGAQGGPAGAALVDGDLVTLASNSVERERAVCFGSEIAVRTWAVLPTNQNELQDYRFKFGIGIEAAYGQRAVVDSQSSIPNYVLLNLAAPRP